MVQFLSLDYQNFGFNQTLYNYPGALQIHCFLTHCQILNSLVRSLLLYHQVNSQTLLKGTF